MARPLSTLLHAFHRSVLFLSVAAFSMGCEGSSEGRQDQTVIVNSEFSSRIAASHDFVLAVKGGKVYGWGTDRHNLISEGKQEISYQHPVVIRGLTEITSVGAGSYHSVALDRRGQVWTWGTDRWGALGLKGAKHQALPSQLEGLPVITQIAVGGAHSLALSAEQEVWAWGSNSAGQAGVPTEQRVSLPHKVSDLPPIKAIYAGTSTSFAVSVTGEVYAWGANNQNKLGLLGGKQHYTPQKVENLCETANIDPGTSSTLFVCSNGDVIAVGDNTTGSLGLGDKHDRTELVVHPDLSGIFKIAGGNPRLALTRDGTLFGWGDEHSGRAESTNKFQLKPEEIDTDAQIIDIQSSGNDAYLITHDTRILRWIPGESWFVDGLYKFFDGYELQPLKNEDGSDFVLTDQARNSKG